MCQPPGKKLSVLSLLSGGEQTLTALALIFAVFFSPTPAPICVLDEVDAPLDDANVGRFCDLLDEMTRATDTRFLIITHHAVTDGADGPALRRDDGRAGVSQLVSVDLKRAERWWRKGAFRPLRAFGPFTPESISGKMKAWQAAERSPPS